MIIWDNFRFVMNPPTILGGPGPPMPKSVMITLEDNLRPQIKQNLRNKTLVQLNNSLNFNIL